MLAPRYDATLPQRAGRFTRDGNWWRTGALDLDGVRINAGQDGFGPVRVVVLGAPGEQPGGYAFYRTRGPVEGPGVVLVDELEAESAPAAAALWSYLASIDLTSTVRARCRPADDPLLYLAADRDQVHVTGQEPNLWLRLVDVRTALTARSWAAPVDLVLDLRDTALPVNAGRFQLTAGPRDPADPARPASPAGPVGATWEPTDDAPDISLDVRELASCYLGGTPLRHFVHAGLGHRAHPGRGPPPGRRPGDRVAALHRGESLSDGCGPAGVLPPRCRGPHPRGRRDRSAAITNTSCHAPSQKQGVPASGPRASKPHFSYARRARGL